MCGRYEIRLDAAGADGEPDAKLAAIAASLERRFPGACKSGEIVPGDTAPTVIAREGRIVAVPATFGLAGFDGKLLINARSETAAEKPTFAEALRERRIILPACGFYEWSRNPQKTKYLFTAESGVPVMYLCGLYNVVGGALRFAILTRAANADMAPVHDRMPVIVGEDAVRAYLTDAAAAADILAHAAPSLVRTPAITQSDR